MSNEVLNVHVDKGRPCGDDAYIFEVAEWAGDYIREQDQRIERLVETLESTANFLRGLTLDPAVPPHAKGAIYVKISAIDTIVEQEVHRE